MIKLRVAKIRNHLAVAELPGTQALLPFRFEDLNIHGLARLLKEVEEVMAEATWLWAVASSMSAFKSEEVTKDGSMVESMKEAWETSSKATTGNMPF